MSMNLTHANATTYTGQPVRVATLLKTPGGAIYGLKTAGGMIVATATSELNLEEKAADQGQDRS